MITLHQLLGINEREFMAEVQGTFKLGIEFANWKNVGPRTPLTGKAKDKARRAKARATLGVFGWKCKLHCDLPAYRS